MFANKNVLANLQQICCK